MLMLIGCKSKNFRMKIVMGNEGFGQPRSLRFIAVGFSQRFHKWQRHMASAAFRTNEAKAMRSLLTLDPSAKADGN